MSASTSANSDKPGHDEGEVMAVVAAAVALTLRQPHRIVSVEKSVPAVETPSYVLNPWSMEGRFQHFGSHKVR